MGRWIRIEALLGPTVAVDAGHVTRVGRHDLGEGEGARRGVREVANPVDSRRAAGAVGDGVERRFTCKAHVAARLLRLLRFPLADGALHGEPHRATAARRTAIRPANTARLNVQLACDRLSSIGQLTTGGWRLTPPRRWPTFGARAPHPRGRPPAAPAEINDDQEEPPCSTAT